jgi:hypothetical protein
VRPDAVEWVRNHAVAAGLTSETALDAALSAVDLARVDSVFREAGFEDRTQVRCLDDALLAIGGQKYIEAVANLPPPAKGTLEGRVATLRWRLTQLRADGADQGGRR